MNPWRAETRRFLLYVSLGALVGMSLDAVGWGVALGAVVFNFVSFRGARELSDWILRDPARDPPDAGTLWGQLYDHLFQKDKSNRTRVVALQELVDKNRQFINALRDAVVVVDREGDLEWWNEAAQHLLGLRRETDRGQAVTNLVRDPRFGRYFRRRQYDGDIEMPSPVLLGVRLNVQIVVFGEGNRLIVARDITRLHNLEQTRKDFVANVSHELRTPLTVLKGYLETFLTTVEPSQRGLYRGLQQMQEQTQRMEALVSDLLMLSRLETQADNAPPSTVDVGAMLRQIHQDARMHAEPTGHSIVLHIETRHGLSGFHEELRSAFSNLVINAVKYTPDKGHIDIRWWVDDSGGHLSVTDDGVGIEAQHIPRLTERFYRADASRNSKTGGTGLGLAIVKHVLLHHDATLDIHSIPGKGSTFTCHFPISRLIHDVSAESLPGDYDASGQLALGFTLPSVNHENC